MRWIFIGLLVVLVACAPGTQSPTETSTEPSIVLSPEEVARGTHVTVSLEGLEAAEARVFIADTEVSADALDRRTLVFFVPYGVPGGLQAVQIGTGDASVRSTLEVTGEIRDIPLSPVLSPKQAARGEAVEVRLETGEKTSVFVAGKEAEVTAIGDNSLSFIVPAEVPGGPQEVLIATAQGDYREVLGVLGDVVQDEVIIIFEASLEREELARKLAELNEKLGTEYALKIKEGDSYTDLDGTDGPCQGNLAEIFIGNRPLGQALEELEKLGDILWEPSPVSQAGPDAVDYISASNARQHATSGFPGVGSVIAVLDTGVSEHEHLQGRLLSGFDFVDNDSDASDEFSDANLPGMPDNDGHGTPVAVLAAGSKFGIAPGAEILPVRVCNQEGCLASNVIKGVCFALNQVEPEKLILNLSLGGDTPVAIVEALLAHTLQTGVPIAVAGGNKGEKMSTGISISPPQYPAAYDLPGLVAVGALEQTSQRANSFAPAAFSNANNYIDISAPGVDLLSGTPDVTQPFQDGYIGTSFATPWVTGTIAVMREAAPNLSPTDIETCLKNTAQSLPPSLAVGAGMLDVAATLACVQ